MDTKTTALMARLIETCNDVIDKDSLTYKQGYTAILGCLAAIVQTHHYSEFEITSLAREFQGVYASIVKD